MLINMKLFVNKYSNTIFIVMVLLLVIFISFMLKKQIDKFNANKWVEPFQDKTNDFVVINNNSDIKCDRAYPKIEFDVLFGFKDNENTIGDHSSNEKYTFENCDHLEEIKFQEGLKKLTIHEKTFRDCENLISPKDNPIRISHNVQDINDYAFDGCINTKFNAIIFPYTLRTIGDNAFSNCLNLGEDIFIPNNVEYIGRHAFNKTTIKNIILEPFRKEKILFKKINSTKSPAGNTQTIYYYDEKNIFDEIDHDTTTLKINEINTKRFWKVT